MIRVFCCPLFCLMRALSFQVNVLLEVGLGFSPLGDIVPVAKRYTEYLQGLHGDIWKGVDVQKYLNGERDAWTNSANG